jgi:two-component system invasion response regulator UvrY
MMAQEDKKGTAGGATIRVLVVEDHQPTREELVRLVGEDKGMTAIADVGTGEEAVETARRLRPAVIVMDIQLPGMNGIEATRIVMSEIPATRIVAVSNHSNPGLVRAFQDAGGMGYVCKDHAFEELIPAIRSALDNRQYLGV